MTLLSFAHSDHLVGQVLLKKGALSAWVRENDIQLSPVTSEGKNEFWELEVSPLWMSGTSELWQ